MNEVANQAAILKHYEEEIREEDRITNGVGQLELVRTQEILRRHLPKPPADILDIGGATGVHAAWLATDGYRVHIVDLAPRHVEKARADLESLGLLFAARAVETEPTLIGLSAHLIAIARAADSKQGGANERQ